MKSNPKQVIGVSLVALQVLACIGNLMGGWETSIFHVTSIGDVISILPFFAVGLIGLLLYWWGCKQK